MKPSEKRALKVEKSEKQIFRSEEAEPQKSQTEQDQSKYEKKAVGNTGESVGYKRKEGFFQSHIRLITFIVTASLILMIFGPLGIDLIIRNKKSHIVDDKQNISIESVYSVYDNRDRIQWSNFKNFNYADYSYDSKTGKYNVREYPIEGTSLILKVGGSNLKSAPDYVYLMDYENGDLINILKEDPREFIRNYKE